MEIEIYTDGAARGNPGRSASGFSVYEKGRLVHEEAFYNGRRTNNFAEYMAMIASLEWCGKHFTAKETGVVLFSDSQLVVSQMDGSYRVKAPALKTLNRRLNSLRKNFKNVEFRNVPRSNSLVSRVDRKLNLLLDGMDNAT